jgi:hypothetical protein
MKQKVVLGLLLLAVFTVGSLVDCHSVQAKVRGSMIVSTEWLAQHLNDKSLVLLHVGDKKSTTRRIFPARNLSRLRTFQRRAEAD